MTDIDEALAANRAALEGLAAAAAGCRETWTTPRAPGKWSPSQVTEHVARSLEESARDVAGEPSAFPTLPAPLRFLARRIFFDRVLRKGAMPKARTTRAMNPLAGPDSPAAARLRLEEACVHFERACRARVSTGRPMRSAIFGTVPVVDYVRFQEIHTRHHTAQMPGSG